MNHCRIINLCVFYVDKLSTIYLFLYIVLLTSVHVKLESSSFYHCLCPSIPLIVFVNGMWSKKLYIIKHNTYTYNIKKKFNIVKA